MNRVGINTIDICYFGGKLNNISLTDKKATPIPFEVDLNLELGPELLFKYTIEDDDTAQVTKLGMRCHRLMDQNWLLPPSIDCMLWIFPTGHQKDLPIMIL